MLSVPHKVRMGSGFAAHHGVTKEKHRESGMCHFESLYVLDHVTNIRVDCVNMDAVPLTETMANCTAHTHNGFGL